MPLLIQFKTTPEQIELVNQARGVMNKAPITSVLVDWRGFLMNALGLYGLEYMREGWLFLGSPVDAEKLAELWGTEVERSGEYFWTVKVSRELLWMDTDGWTWLADREERGLVQDFKQVNEVAQRTISNVRELAA